MATDATHKTWEFEAQHVARMLSPKKLKLSFPLRRAIHVGYATEHYLLVVPSLDDFDLLIDNADVQQVSRIQVPDENIYELPSYENECMLSDSVAHFLNDCVTTADRVHGHGPIWFCINEGF
ncbi:hypothetical protein EV361DRAFT_953009 [Lentinula raphanica]|nr:hypothetical protein EV361DRAFT_953009 [Lentinula raphanica]